VSPAFRRLWAAGFVSELGDWVLRVALPVYVYGLTGSAAATAATFVIGLLPSLALSPVAGVLADRLDRRRVMVAVSLAQAAVLAPLLAVDGPEQLWILNAVTAAQAALAALFEPARHALVPALVDPERLPAANGLIGLGENLARLAGAALGGILLAAGGLPAVLVADAVSFALAALLLARPLGAAAVAARGAAAPVLRSWLDGLRAIRDRPALRSLSGVVALMALSQGIFVVLFVVFVTDRLGGGEAEVGVLRAVQAVGGLLGGGARRRPRAPARGGAPARARAARLRRRRRAGVERPAADHRLRLLPRRVRTRGRAGRARHRGDVLDHRRRRRGRRARAAC
jgi:MFS family permease